MALLSKKIAGLDKKTIKTGGRGFDSLLEKEWLLTNSRGGFSCGTVAGCNTRRYHGLLTGTLNPPANRIMALSNCLEMVEIGNYTKRLSCFEFDGATAADGIEYLKEFTKDGGVHFEYELWDVKVSKSIYMLADTDEIALVYDFSNMIAEFDFSVRPLVAIRDFHSLQKMTTQMSTDWHDNGITVRTGDMQTGSLYLCSEQMRFEEDAQWWNNFHYRKEQQRQADHIEDLWSPGVFKCHVDAPGRIVLFASFGGCGRRVEDECDDVEIAIDSAMLKEKECACAIESDDKMFIELCNAAGQFVIDREIGGKRSATIMAGFPWFLDWGRDTFISLKGLLLCTGRHKEAASVLTTFAGAVDKGMIPNRFDDYGNPPHYNSIDASLWFVHSAFEFLSVTGDMQTFSSKLLPAIRWVMDSYSKGTRFGIKADDDGLITGGNEETQLTWMDAKSGDRAFTPRYGKAVEINALWYSNLCQLAKYYKHKSSDLKGGLDEYYTELAGNVKESFVRLFWNEGLGYLNDCILPDGTVDSSLRPNQVWAVSLPFSPLDDGQKKCIVGVIERELLTAYGLRTLSSADRRFIGRYEGNGFQRNAAYHQGTVWPFLMGGFIEAYLKTNNFTKESKRKALRYLRPLLEHLNHDGCIGSISEIFDGDMPQRPRGCFAQAWSVAEVLRAYKMINE